LGPGYDALGLALDLRDEVTASVTTDQRSSITVSGVGEKELPLDEDHLVLRALRRAFEQLGRTPPAVRLECRNTIPHARGLGSSSAAIVAGVCLARELVIDGSVLLDDAGVLDLAATMEGHPDNVAPALFGGLTIAYAEDGRFRAARLPVDPLVRVMLLVPADPVPTAVARGLLPEQVPHHDAAANAGRAALLVAALTGRPDLLGAATEDRLHQDYREPAMPQTLALVRVLRADGVSAVVSGAGPSVLAFVDAGTEERVRRSAPSGWQVLTPAISPDGARTR
ncbi:MAG: homoserine kinase, partial [Nocardioidaceae bacterium]